MADYDLSTYEGRQAARDAGNWVGADSSGNIVMEAPRASSGGGGGAPPQDPRAVSTNQYGDGIFNTPNGQKTGTQIVQELRAVGWDGTGDPVEVYNRTASAGGAPATPGTAQRPGTPATPGTPQQGFNQAAAQLAAQVADNAAQIAYYNARLGLDSEELAFKKAQQAWQNTFNEATLSGTYQGQPTLAAQQQAANIAAQQAGLTGMYQGSPTLAAQQQQFAQGIAAGGLTGTYQGAPTLAAQQQAAELSGFYGGAPTLAREAEENRTSQAYLNLLAGLRGPADPFQYLRTLQGTPQGLRDIVNAAAGRYTMGGAPSGEVAPRATLGGLVNAATAGAPVAPDLSGMPLANQISPDAYNRMLPSQRSALWAAYEYGGPTGAMRPEDAQAAYAQSLPRYAGPTSGRQALFSV
jgi:hypothetical protein